MTVLITGAGGALGVELKKQFPGALCPSREDLDINDREKVLHYIKQNEIDVIIHSAAITSIRKCEDDKSLAWKTNVDGTKNLVDSLNLINKEGRFVYVSTACVFRGDQSMYTEESIPYPVNFYAITKLVGENIVRTLKNHLVVRTNFIAKKKWPYPKAFSDRFGTYLFSGDVAFGIKEIFQKEVTGIVHIVGSKVLSMYELAKMTTPDIEPMIISEYSGPHLTMNMTLDTKRWKKYEIGFNS